MHRAESQNTEKAEEARGETVSIDYRSAHSYSVSNEANIEKSRECGCFFC